MTDQTRAALLRLEVARLRADPHRCRFDPVLHVGVLGGEPLRTALPAHDPVLDPGTRFEVVLRLLEEEEEEAGGDVWLTRPGEPALQDDDLAWLAAAGRAFAVADAVLRGFWVVTRTGWVDVRTGESRTWKRLRVA